MKVLFVTSFPLSWAKGGVTVQVRETQKALERLGVTVEWVDYNSIEEQRADIIHFWGMPGRIMLQAASTLGMRCVTTFLPPKGFLNFGMKELAAKMQRKALAGVLGAGRAYGLMGIGVEGLDAYFLLNDAERNYVCTCYNWPRERCHIVPNGVSDLFFDNTVSPEVIDGLFYPSFISPRKNQVEIARIAKKHRIPVYFAGGAQGQFPDYYRLFKEEIDDEFAIWLGEVRDPRRLAALYRGAHGTFLSSDFDNQGLILLESLACGTPVMGPRLPSLQSFFGDSIMYCDSAKKSRFSAQLVEFDRFCRSGEKQQFKGLHWDDVARLNLEVYRSLVPEVAEK